jgi:hypothetical protein
MNILKDRAGRGADPDGTECLARRRLDFDALGHPIAWESFQSHGFHPGSFVESIGVPRRELAVTVFAADFRILPLQRENLRVLDFWMLFI